MPSYNIQPILDRNTPPDLSPNAVEPEEVLVSIDADLEPRLSKALHADDMATASFVLGIQHQRDMAIIVTLINDNANRTNNDLHELLGTIKAQGRKVKA